jgi:hypothetical protein
VDSELGWRAVIALNQRLRAKLSKTILSAGVVETRAVLECDEQTMMRAAVGLPLRDDIAKRIAAVVDKWETTE